MKNSSAELINLFSQALVAAACLFTLWIFLQLTPATILSLYELDAPVLAAEKTMAVFAAAYALVIMAGRLRAALKLILR